jgi:DNA segregation ATPase FtsK/SpoIIIE, S-DNA-T family
VLPIPLFISPEKGKNKGKADPGKGKAGPAPAPAKGAAPAKNGPAKGSAAKAPTPKGASGKPGSGPAKGGKPAPNRAPSRGGSGRPSGGGRARPQRPLPAPGMSFDRKLDIIGILLAFVGLITGLSLFASQSDIVPLQAWLNINRQLAGWGVFGLPLAFIGIGLWLVLRKFGDRLPKPEPERIAGLILLYLALLTTFHFFVAETAATVFDPVASGRGGGVIGAALLLMLLSALGTLGSAVLLVAWWIIAILFTAGLSAPELVLLFVGWFQRLRPPKVERQLPLPKPDEHLPAVSPSATRVGRAAAKAPAPAAPPAVTGPAAPPAASAVPPVAGAQPLVAGAAPVTDQPLVIGDVPWELPLVADMLDPGSEVGSSDEADRIRANLIENTLGSFGAPVRVVEVNRGPTITQFGVEPDFIEMRNGKRTKVKVGKIAALADDLALALSAHSVRIEAPVPGKGFVGIEVPNAETSVVALRDVMESERFEHLKGQLRLGLGQDVSGTAIAARLDSMPHLLIAGTTGSGKSVCVNSIIACLLIHNTPDDLKFVMVDPKRVELTGYNGIPHLLTPVVVELERVVASLQWVTREMDERYRKFSKAGVRNIIDFNTRATASHEKRLPYLVIIIDELADLMMLAPDETERTLTRLAQLARATGIHLIIATQRPSVDVVTGLIKANFPARIAFAVASSVDSRVILDQPGAERLLGRGDMLFQSPDAAAPLRMQGVFVADSEIQRIVQFWKDQRPADLPPESVPDSDVAPAAGQPSAPGSPAVTPAPAGPALRQPPSQPALPFAGFDLPGPNDVETPSDGDDELLKEAIQAVREMKKASISLLQRRLRIGYTRSARLIDELEERGIIGPAESGAKPREVISFSDDPAPNQAPTPPASGAAPSAADPAAKRTWTNE